MDRLSADDEVMLWPDARWPQEVGALAILSGDALLGSGGRLRIERVRAVIASRLHLLPRLRQRLVRPARGLGGPLWVDDPAFDLDQHVGVTAVPQPADEAALIRAAERIRRQRLDPSRPLWQMTLLTGFADNRVGLYVKLHHAIADGIAAMATIGVLLDAVPDPPVRAAPPWTAMPAPSTHALLADNLRRRAAKLFSAVPGATHPLAAAHRARAALPGLRDMAAAAPAPVTDLHRVVGADRTLALVRTDLDLVKRIATGADATVNDVLLTAVAGGLRELLIDRGVRVGDDLVMPVDVPITLRPASEWAGARGNRIGQMIVPLPIGVPDPDRRLDRTRAETTARKAGSHPPTGGMLRSRIARRALLRLLARHPVNVTTADLTGPDRPMYLAGARLVEVFPVLPLMGTVTLGVGALSYAGQFGIAAIADGETVPDLDVFAAGVRTDLATLAVGFAGRNTSSSKAHVTVAVDG